MGHRQLLLEENRPQLWGWHPCIQAEEPEMPQEAVNPEASPACPDTSAKSHSPTPTLIKKAFVYAPLTTNRDVGKDKRSL